MGVQAFKFDAVGNRIYPGKTVRTLDWNVTNDTAFPSWLTFTNGDPAALTLSVTPMSTYGQEGRVNLQWGGTPTAAAVSSIKLGWNIDTRQFQEVGILFKDLMVGTAFDGPTKLNMKVSMQSAACGAYFGWNAATQKMEGRLFNATTNIDDWADLPYQIAGNSFGNPRHQLGMALAPCEGAAYLLGGEDTPICRIAPAHPNAANSAWPNPNAAGQMFAPGLEVANPLADASGNAWIRFTGVKAWFVTG